MNETITTNQFKNQSRNPSGGAYRVGMPPFLKILVGFYIIGILSYPLITLFYWFQGLQQQLWDYLFSIDLLHQGTAFPSILVPFILILMVYWTLRGDPRGWALSVFLQLLYFFSGLTRFYILTIKLKDPTFNPAIFLLFEMVIIINYLIIRYYTTQDVLQYFQLQHIKVFRCICILSLVAIVFITVGLTLVTLKG